MVKQCGEQVAKVGMKEMWPLGGSTGRQDKHGLEQVMEKKQGQDTGWA